MITHAINIHLRIKRFLIHSAESETGERAGFPISEHHAKLGEALCDGSAASGRVARCDRGRCE